MDLEALRAAVVSARERAAGDESRLPDLGWAIYAYCLELRNHQDPLTNAYLEILEEGIGVLRRLQRRDQGFIGALGLMLGWQGAAQHRLGRTEHVPNRHRPQRTALLCAGRPAPAGPVATHAVRDCRLTVRARHVHMGLSPLHPARSGHWGAVTVLRPPAQLA
jgi:hypothetical protein